MIILNKKLRGLSVLIASAVFVSGCSTISRVTDAINPFDNNDGQG